MTVLLLDALVPDALAWLQERYEVAYCPELADDMVQLGQLGEAVQAIVFPRHCLVTAECLDLMPNLKALARLHVGTDNTDLSACADRGVKVIHASSSNVRSNAEYLLAALLLLYRRGVVSALAGQKYPQVVMGRELMSSTVGVLGLAPTAQVLVGLLKALGVRVIGYDPAVHRDSPLWTKLGVEPVSLFELMSCSDAVSVQILYAARFRGFIGERALAHCKPGQLWVSLSRSQVFDEYAVADALKDGRIEALLIDGAETNFSAANSPVAGLKNVYITPRLGSHTKEARMRSSWYVAHRLHEAISPFDVRQPTVPTSVFRDWDVRSGEALEGGAGVA